MLMHGCTCSNITDDSTLREIVAKRHCSFNCEREELCSRQAHVDDPEYGHAIPYSDRSAVRKVLMRGPMQRRGEYYSTRGMSARTVLCLYDSEPYPEND